MHPSYLSFTLPKEFVNTYADRPIDWGYPCGAGNHFGELVFLRTYSRTIGQIYDADLGEWRDDHTGTALDALHDNPDDPNYRVRKERWHESVARVVNGMYSIQKDHVMSRRMPWNEEQGQRSAQEAYDRLFAMKWTPPGRGLFAMGSPLVNERRNSAPLFNCGAVDFAVDDPYRFIEACTWLMEASALGIGVGARVPRETSLLVHDPIDVIYITNEEIAEACGDPDGIDSREGWCHTLHLLLEAFLVSGKPLPIFDYTKIRPAGARLRTFGGTASGPDSLRKLHQRITKLLYDRVGQTLRSRDIADIANLIGKCIVAGSMRRSAELLMGQPSDLDFASLKDHTLKKNEERTAPGTGWASLSNNSVQASVGMDYTPFVKNTIQNGEPGFLYVDIARDYGRLVDGIKGDDTAVIVTNPCGEIFLADRELCCLSTIHLNRAEDIEDFKRTIKFAYLYAKTVLLLSTGWPETNTVMLRNQRIGLSVTGVADFVDQYGWAELRRWLDAGYHEVRRWDSIYSRWLCVRESVRVTTVKPEGTVSQLSGASPGGHWKTSRSMIRRMRVTATDPLVKACEAAGYKVEPDDQNPETSVCIEFPVLTGAKRVAHEVSAAEKMELAAQLQHWWADNAVSVTVTFDPDTEASEVEGLLERFEGRLKSVSFAPTFRADGDHGYRQLPEEWVPEETVQEMQSQVSPIDWDSLYNDPDGRDAVDSKFCTTDVCEVTF